MFEDSLLESQGRLVSRSRRWITVGSVGLQCLVAAGIVIVPMVKPEALPFTAVAPAVFVPLVKKPPVIVKAAVVRTSVSSAAVPVVETLRQPTLSGRAFESTIDYGAPVPATTGAMTSMVSSGADPLGVPGPAGPSVVVARPERSGPVKVSSGVSAGMLIGEIRPVYPRLAVAARVEGVVVVEATISKTGNDRECAGGERTADAGGAAIEAVKAARYRPYRLNGDLTEVQTTVTVNFRLGS